MVIKRTLSQLSCIASLLLIVHQGYAQSDFQILSNNEYNGHVHMQLDARTVQSAIDSLSVLISETGSGSSDLSSGLSGRIDSLAQLVVMLDSAQSLGTEGQVLQVTDTDGTLHVSWVDISEYSAGTGMNLSGSEFSIGQSVGTTDDVTFDDITSDSLSASGELSVTGKTILNDSLIVSGSSTISGSLLVDSISVTDVINGQVGSIGNHNLDALNDVPGMGSPGAYLRVKSDSTGLEYATIEAATYTAGTGMNLSGSEFSIGQSVGTTDDVTFDDITSDSLSASGELSVTGKTILNDSLIVSGSSTISGSLLVDSISVTDVINGQVGSIGNHNLDALNDVPGMGSPGAYLRVKSDSTGLEYATIDAASYTAGTGMDLTDGEFSIGQPVAPTDDVTFDDITADTLDATITFLDTAMVGYLNLGDPTNPTDRFTVSTQEDASENFLGMTSYVENFVSATNDIHALSSNFTFLQSETMSLDYAAESSVSQIQGQVGAVKGRNFTGSGLRESYLGVSKDSLLQDLPSDIAAGWTYEDFLVLALSQEMSEDEEFGSDPMAQLNTLASLYGQLPIEMGGGGFLAESSEAPADDVARESKVATKSSAFSAYQSSGYRNIRQAYQAIVDSSSQGYNTFEGEDIFIIDSIDFSTTEAQTALQTYNDEYVDFEFLEMTEQDSGLTVMHDDYGIALSTGTRYQQATDSTVTRIPAVAGLEMHAESGKTVLYADTIELRGAVELYGDLNLSNSIADVMIEQNFGAAELQAGCTSPVAAPNQRTRLNTLDLVTEAPGMTVQPETEDYTYATPGDGWLTITGDDAGGDYFLEAIIQHDPPTSGEGASSSDFNSHTIGVLRGSTTDSLSWAVVEQCQVTNHSIDSDIAVQQFSCYLNHHDTDFNYSFFYDNGSDYERTATLIDLEVRKMNAGELFDQFPPWITANSTSINEEQYSNTSSILVSFILSEETTGFELSDLQTANCTVTDFSGSGSNYTANITTDSEGQCSIIIDAGAFTDAAGNANLPSELIWTHDVTAPTMTIEADEVSDGDTSLDASIGLTFTASENTVDFAAADITVTNGNISNFTGSGSTYTAILYPIYVGACTINVSASTFADAAGNDNTAADEFNWTYETQPTMLILAVDESPSSPVADGDTSSYATLSLTFHASESTDDFTESDISVTYGAISDFAGSGSTYTAKFTPTGDGEKNISVPAGTFTDAAGYANLASNEINYIYDSTAPTMVITADEVSDGDTSLDATLSLTFTASENTDDFAAADITVTNGAISDFTGSGSTYTATFTPTGDGACTINVPASTFTDAAGNDNTAADEFNWTHTVVVN